MNTQVKIKLQESGIEFKENEPLAKYTTWKVGGPADFFVISKDSETLKKIHRIAKECSISLTILGWGSNSLISDEGIRGIVVKNTSQKVQIQGLINNFEANNVTARHVTLDEENYYNFEEIDFDESMYEQVEVEVDSGVFLPFLINNLLEQGITGLQWFSGIPGTIGGAIYNNIHGGKHFFSEYVYSVKTLTPEGSEKIYLKDELQFDYDFSVFHKNEDVILSTKLILFKGDKDRAKEASMSWAKRKRLQPPNSAGCTFQNISNEQQKELGLESNSWGFIIDKILGLKGYSIGGATISHKHAAFIETTQGATASDVLSVISKVFTESKKTLGITPKLEIFLLGFDQETTKRYIP